MAISSIQLGRVSTLLLSDLATRQIDQTQQQLLETQQELSTGLRLNNASNDPGDSAIVLQLNKAMDRQNTYLSNLQRAQSQMGLVDSSMSDLSDLLTQAQTIASQNVGSDVTAAQRAAAATVVQALYNQALSIGNKQFEGKYIFGGDKANIAPFVSAAGGVQFVGSATTLKNTADQNAQLAFQVNGAAVFGSMSSGVTGSADLTPALTPATRLSDLRGATGSGVTPGSIQIGNGTTSAVVDLSTAGNVQDVVNAINNAGVGSITASISGNHLVLSGSASDDITVTDVGGTAAADLGILKTAGGGAGVSLVGTSARPEVTLLTPLASLNGGTGISTAGLVIGNGTQTATISLASVTTVEGLLNAINSSGTGAKAQINASGTGIDVLNSVQGTQLTVGENGGTTAGDLGIRSFSPSTPLGDLNDGRGVSLSTSGPDFQITRSDGSSFTVTLAGAETVQDVIDKINTAAGGVGITAGFATTGNGIVLTDTAGGGGSPTVTPLNASSAVADLGLGQPASGNTITGSDVNPVASAGVFADLARLQAALQGNDQSGITAAAQGLQNDQDRVTATRGQAGAQVQEMQSRQNSLQDQNVSTQALVSQLQDADMAATISKFTTLQTALQATLQTTAKTLNLSLLDFLR